jgi:glycosyltransferase involved in cell wall biosynthesis
VPAARLLDLTRLMSRLGRPVATGIDRVELAYLDRFLADHKAGGPALHALVRLSSFMVLLDADGSNQLAQMARAGLPLPAAGRWARLRFADNPLRAQAETAVYRLARRRVPSLLPNLLLRRLPVDCRYYNVGHSHLTPALFAALRRQGLRSSVLLHDVIPLDYPQYTRAGIPEVFARKMAAVAAGADRVIHTAQVTRQANEAQLRRFGRLPEGVVAPLGIVAPAPGPFHLPGLDPERPYFVAVGTIEPRKNHMLLLDVWERLGKRLPPERMPQLVIAGSRGWRNEEVFARLNAAPAHVIEAPGLDDTALSGLLTGAQGLLFPSLAEGFGLPPLEALALGVPVYVSDLPVLRELLGDTGIYLGTSDVYSWTETIFRALSASPRQRTAAATLREAGSTMAPFDWDAHFKTVLSNDW